MFYFFFLFNSTKKIMKQNNNHVLTIASVDIGYKHLAWCVYECHEPKKEREEGGEKNKIISWEVHEISDKKLSTNALSILMVNFLQENLFDKYLKDKNVLFVVEQQLSHLSRINQSLKNTFFSMSINNKSIKSFKGYVSMPSLKKFKLTQDLFKQSIEELLTTVINQKNKKIEFIIPSKQSNTMKLASEQRIEFLLKHEPKNILDPKNGFFTISNFEQVKNIYFNHSDKKNDDLADCLLQLIAVYYGDLHLYDPKEFFRISFDRTIHNEYDATMIETKNGTNMLDDEQQTVITISDPMNIKNNEPNKMNKRKQNNSSSSFSKRKKVERQNNNMKPPKISIKTTTTNITPK